MRDASIPPDCRMKAALAALPTSTSNQNALQRPIQRQPPDRLKAGPILTRWRRPSRLLNEETTI